MRTFSEEETLLIIASNAVDVDDEEEDGEFKRDSHTHVSI